MIPIKTISIPSSCHQSWNQMTSAEGGRHCQHCCKTVVNFAAMTDAEIISYLATNKGVCGRFETQQLNNLNHKLYADNLSQIGWGKRIVVMLGLMGPIVLRAGAQTKPEMAIVADSVKKTSLVDHIKGDIVLGSDPIGFRTVSGCVDAKEDGLPIPGALIRIKGTLLETVTNAAGRFEMRVPNQFNTLSVHFIGYNSQEIQLPDGVKEYNVQLSLNASLTGEVVIVRGSLPHRMWYRTKRFFKRLL